MVYDVGSPHHQTLYFTSLERTPVDYRCHQLPPFCFMVPLSTHNKLKEEVASLKRAELSRQSELSMLVTRIKTLRV